MPVDYLDTVAGSKGQKTIGLGVHISHGESVGGIACHSYQMCAMDVYRVVVCAFEI